MGTHLEVERKYTMEADTAVPPLDALGAVSAVPPARLEAVYFDTPDRALLGARIALRRRTGGTDAGWHVKLPAAAGRTEVQHPIDPAAPDALPEPIAALLRSRVRGRALAPLALIRTTRTATVVSAGGGAAVEVVDDLVSGSDVRAGTVRRWREWEAEAVGDDQRASERLLERVDAALLAVGARHSPSPAKLAQTLGLGAADPEPRTRTAGEVVRRAVARLTDDLHRDEAALADGGATAVHEMRKTIRRLRAVLAVQGVGGAAAEALRADLKEVGRLLGESRDRDVAADTAEALLAELPRDTPGLADARRELVDAQRAAAREIGAAVLAGFGSPRHFALLDRLESFTPEGPRSGGRPKPVLRAAVARSERRAGRHARRVGDDLDALHDARRAGRRFELLVRALAAAGVEVGASARRAAAAGALVHDALGAHRDIALLDAALPAASERIAATGGNAFAVGVIAERGRRRARAAERAGHRALRRMVRAASR